MRTQLPALACSLLVSLSLVACGDDGGLTGAATGSGGSGNGSGGSSGSGDGGATGTTTGAETTTGSNTTTTSTGQGGGATASSSSGQGGDDTTTASSGGGAGGDTSSSSGAGGDGGASSSSASTASSSASTTASVSASTATSTATSTSTGQQGCLQDPFFQDVECDTCAQGACCDQLEVCLADLDNCLTDDFTSIDPDTAAGDALLDCLTGSCADECTGSGICDSGVTYGDEAVDACLGANCCDDFNFCTSNGTDVDACVQCFIDGGGPLCDDAIICDLVFGCSDAGGCAPGEFECGDGECIPEEWICDDIQDCVDNSDEAACGQGICDSGVTTGDDAQDLCLGASCCDEFNACTSNGLDVDACIACFQAGGGALCDAAIACDELNGCTTGGGGAGICDSGLTTNDPQADECLGDNCCDEFNACTANGLDPQSCIDCFNDPDGGPLCDPAIDCGVSNGCF